MGNPAVAKFWSSIINNVAFQDQLKSVLAVDDKEERALQMMCRALFLFIMEVKLERDEALKKMEESVGVCEYCRKELSGTTRRDTSEAERQVVDIVSNDDEDSPTTILTCSPHVIESTGMMGKEVQVASERIHGVTEAKSKFIGHYRCLGTSRSPLKKSSSNTKSIKNEYKAAAANTPVILVPETQLQVNVSERKALATQTLCIPETLDIEYSSRSVDQEAQGSSDLCGEAGDLNVIVEGLRTPTKPEVMSCKQAESPVLGRPSNRPSGQTSITLPPLGNMLDSPDLQKVGENKRDVIQVTVIPETPTTTTTTAAAVKPEHITSTPRYSPLVFSHGLAAASVNDSFDTSPSLLQAAKINNNTRTCSEVNKKAENHTTIPEAKTWIEPEPVKISLNDSLTSKEFTTRKKKVLQRSASSLTTTSSSKTRVLKKHQSSVDNDRQEGGVYKLTVTSPVAPRKRTFKQTKISEVMFQKMKKMKRQTGRGGEGQAHDMDEDTALQAALRESVKTKELDDLHRQEQQLASEKRKMEYSKEESPIKMPKLSLYKPSSTTCKYSLRSSQESPVKCDSNKGSLHGSYPLKATTSPQGRQKLGNIDEVAAVLEKDSAKQEIIKVQGDGALQTDEPCEPATRNPLSIYKPCEATKQSKSPKKKLSLARGARQRMHDSFDILPEKITDPGFVHQGEVVRGRAARQQLEGWECRECQQWYSDANLDPRERKMLMNKCSRHRSKHNPVTNTPKDFWNPDWVDD